MSSPPTSPRRADSFTSGSPGRTSSPAKSLRNRMTTAMRRASTGLAFAKPALSRSSSKNSLRVDAQAQVAQDEPHAAVSPVAESPAREAEAEAAEAAPPAPLGPSPLAAVTLAEDAPTREPVPAPAPVAEPTPIPAPTPAPVLAPAPIPLLAQTTASPEPIPAPETLGFSDPILPVSSPPIPQESPVLAPRASPRPVVPEVSLLPEPNPQDSVPPLVQPVTPPAIESRSADYFSFGDPVVPPVKEPIAEPAQVEQPAIVSSALEPVPVVETVPAQSGYQTRLPTDSTFAWSEEPALGHKASRSSFLDPAKHSLLPTQTEQPSAMVSRRSSLSSSYGQILPRGRSSSVRFSMDDPFADHFAILPVAQSMDIPKPTLSPVMSMPEPVTEPQLEAEGEDEDEGNPIHESPTPISFPLPPMRDVISAQSSRAATSAYSLGERDGATPADSVHHDTDERIPLLQHAAALPHGGNAKSAPTRGKTAHIVATFASGPITTEIAASHTLHTLGWQEYVLPDSSCYYHHAALRVTTDIDLRNPRQLHYVTDYLGKQLPRDTSMPPPQGWELWVRSAVVTNKNEVNKIRQSWVNHKLRIITADPPPTISGEGLIIERFTEDDKLDMGYRYWGFIEGHPAHVSISTETQTEAMDALKWSYTDCLLPSSRPAPPPFAPQECQELMNLLRSFDDNQDASKNALVVQTRVISRVLLRVAQWRQVYFRPNKPLPKDVIKGVKEEHHRSFGRALMDLIVGCLCLGIPYIFLNRSHHQRFDEESGLYTAGPMLMVSACACLVAAVILSASVTFLSLPQLDDVPRLAGFLAIAFSASSMMSAVVALFRYKTEIDRSVLYLGGEGLMVLSRRSIIFSLPLVFLAWAIAALMTGITLYSFRGATVANPVQIRHPFEPYTHWAVVGTLGGLASLLIIATMVARR